MHAGRSRNKHPTKLQRPFAGFGRLAVTIAIYFALFAAIRSGVAQATLDLQLTFARLDILMTPRSVPEWAATAVIVLGVVLPGKPARSSS
jgi:hypothetical protein